MLGLIPIGGGLFFPLILPSPKPRLSFPNLKNRALEKENPDPGCEYLDLGPRKKAKFKKPKKTKGDDLTLGPLLNKP